VLIQASDGNLYGTTARGGTNGEGAIFRLTIPAAPVAEPSISSGGIVPVYSTATVIQPGEWVSIFGTNLASSTAAWTGNVPTSVGGASVTIDGKPAYLLVCRPRATDSSLRFVAPTTPCRTTARFLLRATGRP
jgi:uncharacterized repeat protein (TIGR03803 family)